MNGLAFEEISALARGDPGLRAGVAGGLSFVSVVGRVGTVLARALRRTVTSAPAARTYRERDDEREQQQRGAGDEQVAQEERHPASYAPAILGMGSGAFAISP